MLISPISCSAQNSIFVLHTSSISAAIMKGGHDDDAGDYEDDDPCTVIALTTAWADWLSLSE